VTSATHTFATQTLAAYERWAFDYPATPHNPLMRAEQGAMLERWPDVRGGRALDLACGTGRYSRLLAESGAREVVALDVSGAMLRQVRHGHRVRSSMTMLPFRPESFDAVICGLALGHADGLERWMRETARVLVPDGRLLYSDFHPDAHRAGLVRTFRDHEGRTWNVPHRRFPVGAQCAALRAAGYTIEAVRELRVGQEIREGFSGSEAFYARWDGLPLVLVVSARR
jgi:ubiquinone/menaquinone biosynthesis C-methylase UbiE